MFKSVAKMILGDANAKELKRHRQRVEEINALQDAMKALSNDGLRQKADELRKRYQEDEEQDLDDLLPEAFALVREASTRTIGLTHFDVQLIGGMVLHEGKIAE